MEVGLPCPASDQAPAHGLVLRPHQCFSPQPCQSSYCYCQEVLDRLIQCGLLVAEEVGQWRQSPGLGSGHLLPPGVLWGWACPWPGRQAWVLPLPVFALGFALYALS